MDRLILICEGEAHTVEYFHQNGVYPGAVVFDISKFREIAPYLTENDEILIVLKGMTDFSFAEVYALLKDIEGYRDKIKGITLVSNIFLGKIQSKYHLYSGDLFYGEMKEVSNGRFIEEQKESTENEKIGLIKSFINKRGTAVKTLDFKTDENSVVNKVMEQYKKYNKKTKFEIYGSKIKERKPNYEADKYIDKVINVNLYK